MKPRPPRKARRSSNERTLNSWLLAQLALASAAGIIVGHFWPQGAVELKPLGDAFSSALRLAVLPLIFLVIIRGIAAMGDVRSLRRIGLKSLAYFTAATAVALLIGLALATAFKPGAGMNIAAPNDHDLTDATGQVSPRAGMTLGFIPNSMIDSLAENPSLQVIGLAIIIGAAMVGVGTDQCAPILNAVEVLLRMVFKIMGWVMRLAPVGAFGAMGYVIGHYGIQSLETYGRLILVCYLAASLFAVALFIIAWSLAGVRLDRFIRLCRREILLALGSGSTELVTPRITAKLNASGCPRSTTGLVIPTGYSLNLDGAALYLSAALLFLLQAHGVELSLGGLLAALALLLLLSKGTAGAPGSSFAALAATIELLGVMPTSAIALLLAVDRILDAMRITVNVLGNCVAAFVISAWEGTLRHGALDETLHRVRAESQRRGPIVRTSQVLPHPVRKGFATWSAGGT